MARRSNRYQKMERVMTCALISDTILFLLYLITAGFGIKWAKFTLAAVAILLSIGILVYLYITQELFKRRSVWMSTAAAAITLCTLVSLIFSFPRPKYTAPGLTHVSGTVSPAIPDDPA